MNNLPKVLFEIYDETIDPVVNIFQISLFGLKDGAIFKWMRSVDEDGWHAQYSQTILIIFFFRTMKPGTKKLGLKYKEAEAFKMYSNYYPLLTVDLLE